ncbi:1328_t:CDS:2 [Ambispora leptoticha]|uniref:Hexosyltransferase n=1 Tax=Ambispora leptoticha TaxID=144679 RepID=A0A9N8V675_9GLOM|nr:1328_t:CDS:2 [Ambispora leptoticha]
MFRLRSFDNESSIVNIKDNESSIVNTKDNESSIVNAKDNESSTVNIKGNEERTRHQKTSVTTKESVTVESNYLSSFLKTDPYDYPIPRRAHMECQSYHEKNNVTFDQLWSYPPTKVLVGIFTTANTFERRQLLRTLYKAAQTELKDDWVDFKFIIGRPKPDQDSPLLQLKLKVEQAAFKDVVMLDIVENLNEGKIYEYFRWAGLTYNENNTVEQYDYIAKADDDAYVHFQNLALNLRPLSREKLYYGYYIPVHEKFGFMTGMLEVLSIDHVRWVSTADIPEKSIIGPEDAMVAQWLELGGWKFVNWIHENCLLYEDPRSNANPWCWRPWASPHTIVFHGMKVDWKWDAKDNTTVILTNSINNEDGNEK